MATTTTDRRQGVSAGQAAKAPVTVATTANITLSGEQTIDGVACVANDRVLVKDQTDASENGIYDVSTGSWSRSPDFDGSHDVLPGTLIPTSSEGSSNGGLTYQVTNTGDITIGTTNLTFSTVSYTSTNFLPLAGGTMTGDIVMSGTANVDLNGTRKLIIDADADTYIGGTATDDRIDFVAQNLTGFQVYGGTTAANTHIEGFATADIPVTGGTATAYTVTTGIWAAYVTDRYYIVRFHAANTSAAPTIDFDGIAAKTIKDKKGNALKIGAIQTDMFGILLYDGTDMLLQNPHILQGEFVNSGDGATYSTTQLALDATHSSGVWETIGPTGSGATNIWTALDNIPTTADWVEIKGQLYMEKASPSVGTVYACTVFARKNGGSTSSSAYNAIGYVSFKAVSTNDMQLEGFLTGKIPLDANNIFDMRYVASGTPTLSIDISVVGYGYNDA